MSGDVKARCDAQNSEDAIKWAAENNLDVVLPDDFTLLIDIDKYADRKVFETNRDLIDAAYGITEVLENYSRSGGTHFTVHLKTPVSRLERIALQAVLGSDLRREAHSLRRLRAGESNPTLFFEKRKESNVSGPTVSE